MPESRGQNGAPRGRDHGPGAGAGAGGRSGGGGGRRGAIGLSRVHDANANDYELVHPRCVLQRRGDYEEGLELREAGDPAGAKEALRFALEGCGDNLWIHVALGRIALDDEGDPELARGHFGYAFELVERALPRGFQGRLPRKLPGNRPFFDAAEGLASCYEAMQRKDEAARVRREAEQLASGSR